MDEDHLAQVIDRAGRLPGVYDGLKAQLGPALLRWDDYPRVALHKLEIAARVQFEAGLALLRDRRLAYAAESHVRSLLEFMAHVAWVTGKDVLRPAGTPRCRAICLELGMTKEFRAQVMASPAEYLGSSETPTGLDERLRELQLLHGANRCTCKPRRSSSVQATLKDIGKLAPHFAMFSRLYDVSSLSVHLFLHDRMIRELQEGVSDFVEADDQLRARLLSWLVPTYGIGVVQILELESVEHARSMNETIRLVQATPILRELGEGDGKSAN